MEIPKKLEMELAKKLAKSGQNNMKTETIREHTDLLLEEARRLYEYGYIDEREFHLLHYACEKHDYGKINEMMQKRLHSRNMKFCSRKEVQHNILSALFVHEEDFDTGEDFLAVLYAVLYHHERHDSDNESFSALIRSNSSIKELVNTFLEQYKDVGATRPSREYLQKMDSFLHTLETAPDFRTDLYYEMTELKGLLHKCDYSASAHIQCEYPNDFLLEKLEASRSFEWNELQRFTMEHENQNLIVTAPTGSGKTEAGLLWAGNHKCFFVLPLRTAINAIYDRIKNDIIKEPEGIQERVALLHSDMRAYYLGEMEADSAGYDDDTLLTYTLRSKQMALPITVATLDKIFDFTLKFYGYEYKLSTLSYSKIIIDEIQMYSPELLAYLIYGIKKIVSFGGKVAVLTATLPPFVKDKLIEILGEETAVNDFSYLGKKRHNVKVIEKELNSEDIIDKWRELESKESRKFLVICNCVETAQRIYKELSKKLQGDGVEVHLFHSRFTKRDRAKKEKQILKAGETYDSDHNINAMHQIWVTTSVVEASLNIDFDYLFTELLELFSLFQRLGRVNRKGVKDISEYNCYVYTELQDGPLKCYRKGEKEFKFVDDDIYCLSKEGLLTLKPGKVLDEKCKTDLINTFLSTDRLKESGYIKKYNETIEWLKGIYIYEKDKKDKCRIRDIENIDIIPYSVYMQHQEAIENAEIRLKENGLDASGRIKLTEEIKQYTVSVNMHRIKENGKWEKTTKIERKISLSRHFKILVVHCEYDCEYGLRKILNNDKRTFSARCI